MFENKLQRYRRTYRRENNLDPIPATVYDYDTVTPGNVLVRFFKSGGELSAPVSVRPPTKFIKLTPGTSVNLEYFRGQLRIADVDNETTLARGTNPLTSIVQQQIPYQLTQASIATLAVTADGSMELAIGAWNPIISGVCYQFPGARVDMTPYLPGAGLMCYGMLALKSDIETIEVTTSTPRSKTDLPLNTPDGINPCPDEQECYDALSAGSKPLMSVKLTGETTGITNDDLRNDGVDRRGLF